MKRRMLTFISASLALVMLAACAGSPASTKSEVATKNEPAVVSAPATPKMEPVAVKADTTALDLALFHVNDTHSKLESAYVEFKADIDSTLRGKRIFVELGGFPRLWTAIDSLRAQYKNSLFLHAGDVFQGSLYFTQFNGMADLDFLNSMGLDGMVTGNHEFDKGPTALVDFAEDAKFPILAANLDLSAEPALAGVIKPYIIKEIAGARVALLGLANPDTPYISSPGPNVKFLDPAESTMKYVKELEGKGVNKIIVLSHLGYDLDVALASKTSGVDVILGGHTHTLLGDYTDIGKAMNAPYPTVQKDASGADVIVATSWQWANAVGVLDLKFDGAGKVLSFTGTSKLLTSPDKLRIYDLPGAGGKMQRVEFTRGTDGKIVVREYDGKAYAAVPTAPVLATYLDAVKKLSDKYATDKRFLFAVSKPEGVAKLKMYSASVDGLKKKIATYAEDELKSKTNNQGPGPYVAESMLWKTGADISIMNPGGVREVFLSGDVSVAQVYELQPFGNTLTTIDMSGMEVMKVLDDMADFCIVAYGKKAETAYVFLAGAKMTLLVNAAKGERVKDVQVLKDDGSWAPLDLAASYKVVVNNFMAAGGDKNFTLEKMPAARKYDTGFIDSEAMLDYVLGKRLKNVSEVRVKNIM